MPDSQPPAGTYFTEISRYLRSYAAVGGPRNLEAARTVILAMAIDRGYSPADVQAVFAVIMQAVPA